MGGVKGFIFLGSRPDGPVPGEHDFSLVESLDLPYDPSVGPEQGLGIGRGSASKGISQKSLEKQPCDQEDDAGSVPAGVFFGLYILGTRKAT